MATYSTEDYSIGAKVRVTADQPQWRQFTHKLPSGTAYASADRINLCKMGDDHQIIAYRVGTNASIAATTGNSTISVNSDADGSAGDDNITGNIADFGGAGATVAGYTSVDHSTTDDGDCFLTLGTLGTAVSSGERAITVSLLVARKEAAAPVNGVRITYSSEYSL